MAALIDALIDLKFWGSGVKDGERVRTTRTTACLRSLQDFINMRAFV